MIEIGRLRLVKKDDTRDGVVVLVIDARQIPELPVLGVGAAASYRADQVVMPRVLWETLEYLATLQPRVAELVRVGTAFNDVGEALAALGKIVTKLRALDYELRNGPL